MRESLAHFVPKVVWSFNAYQHVSLRDYKTQQEYRAFIQGKVGLTSWLWKGHRTEWAYSLMITGNVFPTVAPCETQRLGTRYKGTSSYNSVSTSSIFPKSMFIPDARET